ncbi:MAG: hypothetical protein ACUVR8_06115 [Acidobacteriota bacterium]
MTTSQAPSFGILGPVSSLLQPIIESCRYLGLPEADSEMADIILTDEQPARASYQMTPWLRWKGLTVHRRDSFLIVAYDDCQVALDVVRRRIMPVRLPLAADGFSSYELLSYLRLVLLFMLRRLGWFELHAGACVNAGQGYVFTGPPGSGKTSAVLGLIEAGWGYTSDDALLVRQTSRLRSSPSISVRAGRVLFSVTSDSLSRFPALQPYAERRWQRFEKWLINPTTLWPQRRVVTAEPTFLFFCQLHDAEETRVLPVAVTDALSRLMENSPWLALDRETSRSHLVTYRKLVESCYSFTLLAGRDVLHEPSRLASYLTATDLIRLHHHV